MPAFDIWQFEAGLRDKNTKCRTLNLHLLQFTGAGIQRDRLDRLKKVINLLSEREVIARWQGDISKSIVTIVCTAYNHEQYIEDAIKGFLIQRTNFPFEVVIHDDASTDGTAEIIKRYADAYPQIIKPVFQQVNQFSQLKMQMLVNLINGSAGRYIAICEGDDYWIEPTKLQSQYDLMEADSGAAICIHNAIRKNLYNDEDSVFNFKKIPDYLTSFDVVTRAWFSPTASFFFRKIQLPCIPNGINGDVFILMMCSQKGHIRYDNRAYSVYRYGSVGSLSELSSKSDLYNKKINFLRYCAKLMGLKFWLVIKFHIFALMIKKMVIK